MGADRVGRAEEGGDARQGGEQGGGGEVVGLGGEGVDVENAEGRRLVRMGGRAVLG